MVSATYTPQKEEEVASSSSSVNSLVGSSRGNRDRTESANKIYTHLTQVFGQVLPLSGLTLHPENVLPDSQPLLCFVNSRAGGYQVSYIYDRFLDLQIYCLIYAIFSPAI